MMEKGELTSVELTRAYLARIDALNKRGPGLNAVTQYNKAALDEAAKADALRAEGKVLGPAHGLPILLKDLIDVKGMYTSAGNYSLRNSYPETDSGIVKKLRASGVVILGKLGLSEYANSFGNQHSGFANLTGQVLNGLDADQGPSGSSSGTGAAGAAALSALTIGTETSGSIISPSQANGLVGLRPTVGLVPGYGIAPISANQDTAGPMDRTVSDAAMNLQSTAGFDPLSKPGYASLFGPNVDAVIPPAPAEVPNYMSALKTDFVQGMRIGYNGTVGGGNPTVGPGPDFTPIAGTPLADAYAALVAGGATMVYRPSPGNANLAAVPLPTGYEQHITINSYYARLGASAPIKSLAEEVDDNNANPHEALKFGNSSHANSLNADITPGGANEIQYRTNLPQRKALYWAQINGMLDNGTPDTSDDVAAILGSVPQGPQAGYPQLTIPMGYSATLRRALSISVNGGAYKERDVIGISYVIEQATKKRKPASEVNPSMYRCADTVPAPAFSERGSCNPDYDTIMEKVGTRPALGFSLETESAKDLQDRLVDGTLTSETLTKAYLARIALTNAEGPALQAVRAVNLGAIDEAKALDQERVTEGRRGPFHGLPVIVDDTIDVKGMPTTAGSIGLQGSVPTKDSKIVARLKAGGAIILGKANVSEMNGVLDSNATEGYSALGGQVLLPSDTDNNVGGSSGGSTAAAAAGLAAMTIGMETSTDTAQMINPAALAGVVALKPTVGRVSRTGVLPVAKSQDAPGPIAKSVYDVALGLQVISAKDPEDSATSAAPTAPRYTDVLSASALKNKKVGVITSVAASYPGAVAAIADAGATTVTKTLPAAPTTPSIVTREFKRDLNAYLSGIPGAGAKSLQGVIDANVASPVEGLKYNQRDLVDAQTVDLADGPTATAYDTDKTTGLAEAKAYIDGLLNNGTPADLTDDVEIMAVPSGNPLIGIADRAGYPVLTVPSGFGSTVNGSAQNGRNPIGIVFIGAPFSEATLLADGYAFEQATKVRLAPSWTNPSMFRCVPGSTFYSPHHCHPGDRAYASPFVPLTDPVIPPTTPAVVTPPVVTPPVVAPPVVKPPVVKKPIVQFTVKTIKASKSGTFKVSVKCSKTAGDCTVKVRVMRGSKKLGVKTLTIKSGKSAALTVKPDSATKKSLAKGSKVKVKITFIGLSGSAAPTTKTVTVKP